MINLFADYHTHTVYSDGKGTILGNVIAARKKGLKEIAIADHGRGHFSFGIEKGDLKKMREEIDRINDTDPGVKVLLGIEANLASMDGDIDIDEESMKYLDILLMGYHTAVVPKNFKDARGLYIDNIGAKISPVIYDRAREHNTEALIKAINKNKIDIITHPGAGLAINTGELAKEAAKVGTALEINCSHDEITVEFINTAKEQGVNFVISSDAHSPESIGDFQKGIRKAELAGLPAERILNALKQ